MTKYSCLLVGNQNINNLVHAPRSCSRKQRLTLCSSEEPLLPLLDEEDALLLELVRGLRGEGGNLALVEPHPPHRLHSLQEKKQRYTTIKSVSDSVHVAKQFPQLLISTFSSACSCLYAYYTEPKMRQPYVGPLIYILSGFLDS